MDEHCDRLARFGVEYLEAALAAQGWCLVLVEQPEMADDLVRDMVEVLTGLCSCRRAKTPVATTQARVVA